MIIPKHMLPGESMTIGAKLRSAAAAVVFAAAMPAYGAISDPLQTKSVVEQFLDRLAAETNGIVEWKGADQLDSRQEAGETITSIDNARFDIKNTGKLVLDHFEIRTAPVPGDGGLTRYSASFPGQATLTTEKGEDVKLTLNKARGSGIVDGKGRSREGALNFAGARIEVDKGASWLNFGPLDLTTAVALAGDGSWKAPLAMTLGKIEFFIAEGPVSGAIDRIVYSGESGGPDFAALEKMRDEITAWQKDKTSPDDARIARMVEILTGLPTVFSGIQGEFVLEKLGVRLATGEALVSLEKARLASGLTGLAGDKAALRITLSHEGLELGPSVLPPNKVPRRIVIDFGVEEAKTEALRTILQALGKMGPDAPEAAKAQATAQMMGALAMMAPVLRIYDVAVDLKDAGIDVTAKAAGSPLSPQGYSAEGDVVVRGIDAVPAIFGPLPGFEWLAFVKELGSEGKGADGTPRLTYHLASAPGKWLTLNGADVTAWFSKPAGPGEPRVLKPEDPPMSGADVEAVQRALAAANLKVPQDGVYGAPTATAVARYQKSHGLDVTGLVDAPTRLKLGIKLETPPAPPAPGHPGPRGAAPPAPGQKR